MKISFSVEIWKSPMIYFGTFITSRNCHKICLVTNILVFKRMTPGLGLPSLVYPEHILLRNRIFRTSCIIYYWSIVLEKIMYFEDSWRIQEETDQELHLPKSNLLTEVRADLFKFFKLCTWLSTIFSSLTPSTCFEYTYF